ncbi:hypothetical protein ABZ726_34310 [Streptomyces hundungensis]|uniref:aromatic-ring hydroxylase C-terminal domain-containing protein n=1 Tax=Streptomyces hundungensis TaxID=1077946 RepID=UPI00340905F0
MPVAVHPIVAGKPGSEPGAGVLYDAEGAWCDVVGLSPKGAVLVRPDGFVAARSDEGLTPDSLEGIWHSVIGR